RAYPLEPSPVAKQTHADASDEASVSNEAAMANTARVRPIWPPFEALGPVLRARAFLSVSFGELRAQVANIIKFTPRRREVPSAECVELRLGADCSLEITVPDPAGNVAESSDSRSYPSQTDLAPVGCTTVGISGAAARRWHHELESL